MKDIITVRLIDYVDKNRIEK